MMDIAVAAAESAPAPQQSQDPAGSAAPARPGQLVEVGGVLTPPSSPQGRGVTSSSHQDEWISDIPVTANDLYPQLIVKRPILMPTLRPMELDDPDTAPPVVQAPGGNAAPPGHSLLAKSGGVLTPPSPHAVTSPPSAVDAA